MGHMLEKAAVSRGHSVVTCDIVAPDAHVISSDPAVFAAEIKKSGADGIIEFTHPSAVRANLDALIPTALPLVVGTTGWYDDCELFAAKVADAGSALLYSPNFSVGVNLFYKIVEEAARLMNGFEEYDAALWEMHHNQKADSPSGTALEAARRVLARLDRKTSMVTTSFDRKPRSDELHVASVRLGSVPGTHTVAFDSVADTIEITHTARSREGFAMGAVRALEWLAAPDEHGKPHAGIFTTDDVYCDMC